MAQYRHLYGESHDYGRQRYHLGPSVHEYAALHRTCFQRVNCTLPPPSRQDGEAWSFAPVRMLFCNSDNTKSLVIYLTSRRETPPPQDPHPGLGLPVRAKCSVGCTESPGQIHSPALKNSISPFFKSYSGALLMWGQPFDSRPTLLPIIFFILFSWCLGTI